MGWSARGSGWSVGVKGRVPGAVVGVWGCGVECQGQWLECGGVGWSARGSGWSEGVWGGVPGAVVGV